MHLQQFPMHEKLKQQNSPIYKNMFATMFSEYNYYWRKKTPTKQQNSIKKNNTH